MTKLGTTLRLIQTGDWSVLRRQWAINSAPIRARMHGGRAFVNRDLGFPSVCHPDWPDSWNQFTGRAGDMWEFSIVRRWLRPGDVAYDLGANLGLYACAAAARVSATGRVIAVDADPYVVGKLQHTASRLGARQLLAVHAAVTDHDGTLTFFVHEGRASTDGQSLHPTAEQRASSVAVTVPARTMASLDRDGHDRIPALVKVDIEGAEGSAFAAAPPAWLGSDGPLWIVEINPAALARFGAHPRDVLRHFSRAAFDCWLLPKHPSDPSVSPVLRRLDAADAFSDSMYYNLIAVPTGTRFADRRLDIQALFPSRGAQ